MRVDLFADRPGGGSAATSNRTAVRALQLTNLFDLWQLWGTQAAISH